jgi:DNA-binding transcriptional LysR family regulator
MELLQLRYFLDAAKTENFSETAKRNLVPQPSISKTIKKLEQELGVNLFDRNGKKIVLNQNGRFFYEKVSIAISNIDEGVNHFKQSENSNITIYTQAGSRFVSLLIADFLTNTHNIFVSTANQLSGGKAPDYDLTFMQPLDNMEEYNFIKLMDDEIIAVIPTTNPLSSKNLLSIKDLKNQSFVGYYKSIELRDFTDKYCMKYGNFIPNVVFETHDYSAIRYMLDKGKGIALMPKVFFKLQYSDRVKLVPLNEKVKRQLVLAWSKNRQLTKAEQEFVSYSKKWFRKF